MCLETVDGANLSSFDQLANADFLVTQSQESGNRFSSESARVMVNTDSMVPRIFRYMAKYSNVKAHGQEKIQP